MKYLILLTLLAVMPVSAASYKKTPSSKQKKSAYLDSVEGEGKLRPYSNPLLDSEAVEIRYIVSTLANKPLASLLMDSSSLRAAGARVDHVHPLRFLQAVFVDEQLKVDIRNIRSRSWVWSDFMKGLGNSFTAAQRRNNLKPEYVQDFAGIVGIDPSLIQDKIDQGRWEDVVVVLIENVPRKGNTDRYNM